jgi:hypothetical protein
MSHDQSSFKKVAVLTGLTMVVGGVEISEAGAATLSQTITMPTVQVSTSSSGSNSATLNFDSFNNPSLPTAGATLTDVQFSLISDISNSFGESTFADSFSATVNVDGVQIGPAGTTAGPFSFGPTEGVPPALSFYEGSGTFPVALQLSVTSCSSEGEPFCQVTWDIPAVDSVEVTYTYTPTSATPVPAALPLFATGLAGLGFSTWRSRRKQKTKKQA